MKTLSAIGGSGILVGFIIWFIQNVIQFWQERIMKRLDYAHDREMAITNNQIERKTHIYYRLAEAEFEALQNIWVSLFSYVVAVSELIPIMDEIPKDISGEIKEYKGRFRKYADSHNEYVNVLHKSKPVINNDIFVICERALTAGRRCGASFQVHYCCQETELEDFKRAFWEIEHKNHEYRNNENALYAIRDELCEAIRSRYDHLSVI